MTGNEITLLELNRRVAAALSLSPGLDNVWVTAETSDLRVSGGHCYMELVQKDDNGTPVARCRAVVWASTFSKLSAKFAGATGAQLRSDIKIKVLVRVNFHSVFGLSLVVNDIDPSYTIGDLARRRMEILAQLAADGVADLNRNLPLADVPSRVAIISAKGAAGYGDFVRQLHNNPMRLRFSTTLFEATMQGERTAPSIIAALDSIMQTIDSFDCVVIIRGGGAVADLASFDDYDLAFNVAQFPLPVIVGIGHDRDVTVLDYVAKIRVKTPTAAAETLIGLVGASYDRIRALGEAILAGVRDTVYGHSRQLAYYQGLIPALAQNVIDRNRSKVSDTVATAIADSARAVLNRNIRRLDALQELAEALSPEATLRRGYSITRINGHAVTDGDMLKKGDIIETSFAAGTPKRSVIG